MQTSSASHSAKGQAFFRLPPLLLPVAALLFLLCGFGPNMPLAAFAIVILISGAGLLWRPGELPILLFLFCFMWVQASIAVLFSNVLGMPVQDIAEYGGQQDLAIVLTLVGLLVLAIGIWLGAGPWNRAVGERARAAILRHKGNFWFRLYVLALGGSLLATSAAWVVPGLSQPLLAVSGLHWAFFWLLGFAAMSGSDGAKKLFFLSFTIEFLMSFGGFFSDFKMVFIFTLFAIICANVQISFRKGLAIFMLSIALVALGTVWTAIKVPYRTLISGGGGQVASISYTERMLILSDMIRLLDESTMQLAGVQLISRISYVQFFAVVLDTVPNRIPHTDGALWADAIIRPFTPRLFFPGKTVIDDSTQTNYYTGGALEGAALQGNTSISMGSMAEAYIDFGKWGMMLLQFGMGFFYGRMYRWLINDKTVAWPLGMGLAASIIFVGSDLASSITKIFGGVLVSLLVGVLILKIIVPRFFGESAATR